MFRPAHTGVRFDLRIGTARRAGLLLTLSLMSIGIFSIAFTPGHATLGWIAPLARHECRADS